MYDTPNVSIELLNSGFCDKVFGGQLKEAMESGSMYIRTQLHEDGILRRLFDSRTVGAEELDPVLEDDIPSIICEIEPGAAKATFVSFKGTGDHRYFTGSRYRIPFGKIESETMHKSRFELMSIRMPITDWLKENQVKALQQEEDSAFLKVVGDIVAAEAAQNLTVTYTGGESFKDVFTTGMKALNSLRLPYGKVLMHKNTFLDSLKLKTDEIGFKPQEDRFIRGVDGEDSFMGLPVVTTIKDDLVKENEIYFFTQQDYFLKYFLLQDATLFMKTEKDMIEFSTYMAPGVGIGNTKGVVKVTIA